jgi:hypothetical protein
MKLSALTPNGRFAANSGVPPPADTPPAPLEMARSRRLMLREKWNFPGVNQPAEQAHETGVGGR